jgi:hypothetical protein
MSHHDNMTCVIVSPLPCGGVVGYLAFVVKTCALIASSPAPMLPSWEGNPLALAPSREDCRAMVRELFDRLGRWQAARALGVPMITADQWLAKGPGWMATRRSVWLVWCLCLHPERCTTVFDLVTWGRFASRSAKQSAPSLPPCDGSDWVI